MHKYDFEKNGNKYSIKRASKGVAVFSAVYANGNSNRKVIQCPADWTKNIILACAGKKPLVPLPYGIEHPWLNIFDTESPPWELWYCALTDTNDGSVVFDDKKKLAAMIENVDFYSYDEEKVNKIRSHFCKKQQGKASVVFDAEDAEKDDA